MKVLVCDDKEKDGKNTLDAIAIQTAHTKLVFGDNLRAEIEKLFARVRTVLDNPESTFPGARSDPSVFEQDFDIVILDNNLSGLKIEGALHTAESIAGYIRAFAKIPYIVSLNKNPQVDFDLRYLVGDYQTQADLAVNASHLSNSGLWTGNSIDAEFLPWYWPPLDLVAARRRRQIQFVAEHLSDPILRTFGFPRSTAAYLSRHARGALSAALKLTDRVTFKKFFVTSCRSLPLPRQREILARSTRPADGAAREVVSRVVAGELDRWFRRDLLGPQDVLVDLPHLLMRMPFLLGSHAGNLERWNKVLVETEPPYGLSAEIYQTYLDSARFLHGDWIKSPCFWWMDLKSNAKLNQMFFSGDSSWAEAVFCEDLSRFKSWHDGPPSEFVAEFEGAWSRRCVAQLKGKHYAPKSRLAK